MMDDAPARFAHFVLVACSAIFLAGCYRMPTDDDFSLVPTTNNPAVTCEKSEGLPGMKL